MLLIEKVQDETNDHYECYFLQFYSQVPLQNSHAFMLVLHFINQEENYANKGPGTFEE